MARRTAFPRQRTSDVAVLMARTLWILGAPDATAVEVLVEPGG